MKKSDYFRDFQDGSFRCVAFWIGERNNEEVMFTAQTILEWQDITQVQAWPNPSILPDDQTPADAKCLITSCGVEIMILARFIEVAKAWSQYRRSVPLPLISAN